MDWYITLLSNNYQRPKHLAPLIELLERINAGESVKAVVHAPPRHAKSESLLHSIPWFLDSHPAWTMGYFSYGDHIASSKSRVAMGLAKQDGIQLVSENITEWRNASRGGCISGGIGGPLTGFGLNVGFIDDAIKNRAMAESAKMRDSTWEWFRDTFMTRIEPGGSVIVNMTRWHEDDLSGRIIKHLGWPYICLPAIDAGGKALWPERWPVEALQKRREEVGEYAWASLYQGQPRPRGGTVFGDPVGFPQDSTGRQIEPTGYRTAIGIDLAYTKKTSSDFSAIVVMGEQDGLFYVLEVHRVQMRTPDFAKKLEEVRSRHHFARVRWYAAGTEQGVADMLSQQSEAYLPIEALAPKGDKFVRAIDYAAAWNAGKIRVPTDSENRPWLDDFLVEHANFTGVNDAHDDMVDAAVAAYDVLAAELQSFYPIHDDSVSFSRRM